MRTKVLIPLLGLALISAPACQKDDSNAERSEYIEVYKSIEDAQAPDAEPLKAVCVSVLEGNTTIYVKTNVDITASWQDALESSWGKVVRCEPSTTEGFWEVEVYAKRISSTPYYTRRTGTLIIKATDAKFFAKHLQVHQGSVARLSCNFSWLGYGITDPRSTDNEKIIGSWNESQKSYKYTSTPFKGTTTAYCYGKNGYIRLGDEEGHGADIITPFAESFRLDSLVMLSFNAVRFTSIEGETDEGKISVEILGGGVIADTEQTKIEFEAPTYDTLNEKFPNSMWDGAGFLVFFKSIPGNELGLNTQFRITAGSLTATTQPNRVFVDNIYVRKLGIGEDEDYMAENLNETTGLSSGPDMILGAPVETN